jgi:MFS family permease
VTNSRGVKSSALLIGVLCLAELTAGYEMSMVMAALKTLLHEFGAPDRVGWLVTSYLLVAAASAAICGRLGDLYGRSRVLIVVLCCATAGSLLSAVSTSLEVIIVGRAVQGMAGAVLPLCFGLARENLPPARVPFAVGLLTAVASVGVAVGLVVGGLIVDHLDWRYIFVASSTLAGLSVLAVVLVLPTSPCAIRHGRPDVLGGVLFAPAIAGALLAFGGSRHWGARNSLLLVGSTLLFAFWVWYERRHPQPLINVRLLARRDVAIPNLCMALLAIGAMQLVPVLMLLLQQPVATGIGLGVSATLAAFLKLPGNLVGAVAASWGGQMASQRGGRRVILLGATLSVVAWTLLMVQHSVLWLVVTAAALCSFGTMMAMVGMTSIIVESVPAGQTSEATGFMQVVKSVFMGVGAQVVLILLATSTVADPGTPVGKFPDEPAYMLTFGFIVATGLAAIAAAVALPRPESSRVTAAAMEPTPVEEAS